MTLALGKFQFQPAVKLMLPKEHGSWSLALEPLALGLLAAPSPTGGAFAVAALAGFFLRRPLKLAVNGKTDPRRWLALNCALALVATAIAGLAFTISAGSIANLWPLVPAALVAVAFAWADFRNRGRDSTAEICGAVAFGMLPAVFAMLAGWSTIESLALAAVMLSRSIPTVLFVRTYLRSKKRQTRSMSPALVAATAGLLLVTWLAVEKAAPWLAVIFALILAARTIYLLGLRPDFSAKTIGMAEAAFGAVMAMAVAGAWRFL